MIQACRLFAPLLVLALVAVPALSLAHSAGGLDPHGCHTDRRSGAYHCHRGRYSGLKFTSKAEMLRKKAEGYTGEDQRAAAGDDDGSIIGKLWPSKDRAEDREETEQQAAVEPGSNVIIPKGIEQRLAVLKDLHDKELIDDEEYAQKKREILGDL